MSSPAGHSLAGLIVYRVVHGSTSGIAWGRLALYAFAANAADLDFVPGVLLGDPNRYHHGISHSIGLALLFAFVFSFLFLQKRYSFKKNFTIFFCLYFSHIVLDYLSIDTSFPYGEPVFWPLSNDYYIAPFVFFPDIQRASSGSDSQVFLSLFSLHNLWAVTIEVLILVPVIIVIWILQKQPKARVPKAAALF